MKEGNNTDQENTLISDFEIFEKEFLLAHKKYSDLSEKADLFDPNVLAIVREIIDIKNSLREGNKIDLISDALSMLSKQSKVPKEYKEFLNNYISATQELALSSENLLRAKINIFFEKMGIDIPPIYDRENQLIRILNHRESNTSYDLSLLSGDSNSLLYEIYSAFLRKEIILNRDGQLVPRSVFGEELINKAKEEVFNIASREFFVGKDSITPEIAFLHIFKLQNNLVGLVRLNNDEEVFTNIKDLIRKGDIVLNKNGQLSSTTLVGENFISALRKRIFSKIVKDYRDFHYLNNKTTLQNRELFKRLNNDKELNETAFKKHSDFSKKVAEEKRIDDILRKEYTNALAGAEKKKDTFHSIINDYFNDLEALSSTDSVFQPDLTRFLSLYSSMNPQIQELACSMSEISYLSSLVQEVDNFEKELSRKLSVKEPAHNKEKVTISRAQATNTKINKGRIRLVLANKVRSVFDRKSRNKHLPESVSTKIINQILSSKEFDNYIDLFIEQETIKQILIEEIMRNRDIYSRTLKIRNGVNSLFIIEVSKEKMLSQIIANVDYLIEEYELQKIRMDNLKHIRLSSSVGDKMHELQDTHKLIEVLRKKILGLVNDYNKEINSNFRKIESLHERVNEKSAKKKDIVKNSNKIYNEFVRTKENNKKIIEKYELEIAKIDKEIIGLKGKIKTESRAI